MAELLAAVAAVGLPTAIVLYIALQPDKAQRIAGWAWSFASTVFHFGDRKAVGLRVQGGINSARATLMKNAPEGLLDSKLRISWNDADSAHAVVRDGEVVVCMKRSRHHEENMAHALMAYLPKAVLPRARRYVDKSTMRAADLTIAKSILGGIDHRPGALDVFFDEHLDPAREGDPELRTRIAEIDEIDLHGWLLRVLLPEFRAVGDELHPGEVDPRSHADAEAFVRWLYRLAAREPGDETMPLSYEGRYFRVAVVLVAQRLKLLENGPEPYRKQAKRLVYDGRYDAVYLMGRDDNIEAVRTIHERLRTDGRVAATDCHVFDLRPDFRKRKLDRSRAVIACLRPHHPHGRAEPDEELPEVEVERFNPATADAQVLGPMREGPPQEPGSTARFRRGLAEHAPELVQRREKTQRGS